MSLENRTGSWLLPSLKISTTIYRVVQIKVYDRVCSLNQLINCYILFLYLYTDNSLKGHRWTLLCYRTTFTRINFIFIILLKLAMIDNIMRTYIFYIFLKVTMNILASDSKQIRWLFIFVHQKCWKLAFKTDFSVYNIHLYLCWQVENTKCILCCRKMVLNVQKLRFLMYMIFSLNKSQFHLLIF